MSYDFYLPCKPTEPTLVTIEDDGAITFHDDEVIEEIDTMLAMEELGFEQDTSQEDICVRAFCQWRGAPAYFITQSGAIPFMDAGLVACAWAEASFFLLLSDALTPPGSNIPELGHRSLERAKRFFEGKPIHHRRVLDDRRYLQQILSDNQRQDRFGLLDIRPAVYGVASVKACLDCIVDIARQESAFGFVRDLIEPLYEPASRLFLQLENKQMTSESITEKIREIAVSALMEASWIPGGRR